MVELAVDKLTVAGTELSGQAILNDQRGLDSVQRVQFRIGWNALHAKSRSATLLRDAAARGGLTDTPHDTNGDEII